MLHRILLVFVWIILLLSVAATPATSNAESTSGQQEMLEPIPFRVIAVIGSEGVRIPPPVGFSSKAKSPTASFSINYLAAGSSDAWGEPCLAWDSNAQAAFTYATSIWATLIQSSVPIQIEACWANLGSPSILGYSGSNLVRDFGVGQSGTWYHYSLADALAASDLDPGTPDFYVTYNNGFSWYFGTDGATPSGEYDFVTVVMHEVGHGLNFAGTMVWDTPPGDANECGTGRWGCWGYGTGYPSIYDRFTENGSGQALITSFTNPSRALGNQLISDNLYFDGPNTNIANGGSPARIYAPTTWSSGSSYSHLNYATFSGTANRLMVYAISSGSSLHDPGSVTMGILSDLGWAPTYLVDDDFTSSTHGWGHTHFASIQNAINAIPARGIVMVADGTYNEAVTLNKSITVRLEGNVTVGGNVVISSGTFVATTNTLALTGNLTLSGGTFNAGSGTVTFSGSALQRVSGTIAFNNLSTASTAKVYLANTPSVVGTVSNSGTLSQTQVLNNGNNFNFLQISTDKYRGIDISATANLGQVSVAVKGNTIQCTNDSGSYNYRNRCFRVSSQNPGSANMIFYTTVGEDDVSSDALYQFSGGSWLARSASCSGTPGGTCSASGINLLTGNNHFLIGSSSAPTALTLRSLSARKDPDRLGLALAVGSGTIAMLSLDWGVRRRMAKK